VTLTLSKRENNLWNHPVSWNQNQVVNQMVNLI